MFPSAEFFISTANDECPGVRLSAHGVLDNGYKYGWNAGAFEIEDTIVTPTTRHQLPDGESRAHVRKAADGVECNPLRARMPFACEPAMHTPWLIQRGSPTNSSPAPGVLFICRNLP